MTNLEKYFPKYKLADFQRQGNPLTQDPRCKRPITLSCSECPAWDFCQVDKHTRCVDTFKAWAEMEVK